MAFECVFLYLLQLGDLLLNLLLSLLEIFLQLGDGFVLVRHLFLQISFFLCVDFKLTLEFAIAFFTVSFLKLSCFFLSFSTLDLRFKRLDPRFLHH